jgi:hypothetical protein
MDAATGDLDDLPDPLPSRAPEPPSAVLGRLRDSEH